jgi:hypothetical protein
LYALQLSLSLLDSYRLWALRSLFKFTDKFPKPVTHTSLIMSTATTSLSDTLPSSIPKLDASGINWAIFSVRFQDAIEAKGFWDHFDGSSIRPEQSYTAVVTAADGSTTGGKEVTPADELATSQRQWDKDERSAKSLLTQKIPDSTLMRIHTKSTVVERWNSIVMEYTEKGSYAQTDLRQKFLELRGQCP